MRQVNMPLVVTFLLILTLSPVLAGAEAEELASGHTYVAPNAVQVQELGIFTTIALTNTTHYWFNAKIYLIDPDGEVVTQLNPLLKSFGTWQKATVDIVAEDFRGSVWVISPQPIVSAAFIHQFNPDGDLSLLGNTKLEEVDSTHAQTRLNAEN
jgi:hypothetical protein